MAETVQYPFVSGFQPWKVEISQVYFNLGARVYRTDSLIIGIYFEERDLIAQFGNRYRQYREQVSMLLP